MQAHQNSSVKSSTNLAEVKAWSKYNFIPGDIIIFQDDSIGVENGEFPSPCDLIKGNAENGNIINY